VYKEVEMKRAAIMFLIVIVISVLIGIGSGSYWGGIITFLVLGLIATIIDMQYRAHGAKPIARKLLEQENPSIVEVDKCIKDLGGSGLNDTECKELIRRLMAKRDEIRT
jgi:hypothetical protein